MAGTITFNQVDRYLHEFTAFKVLCNKAKSVKPFQGVLLAIDPGETTGWATFRVADQKVYLIGFGQEETFPMDRCVHGLSRLLETFQPTTVVHELYAVYEWKTDSHAWSQVPTLRIIGSLETLCIQQSKPLYSQTAQLAKNFCTDDKLKAWKLYEKGLQHARDAIRHGTYFLLFGQ